MSQQKKVREPVENTLALDRTILANERTFQAWIRTGLALLVAGLGIMKFLREELPFGSSVLISVLLIVFSAGAFVLAAWRYRHVHLKISHLDVDMIPLWIIVTLSMLLAAGALLAAGGILFASVW